MIIISCMNFFKPVRSAHLVLYNRKLIILKHIGGNILIKVYVGLLMQG